MTTLERLDKAVNKANLMVWLALVDYYKKEMVR